MADERPIADPFDAFEEEAVEDEQQVDAEKKSLDAVAPAAAKARRQKRRGHVPTVTQILSHELTKLANASWASAAPPPFTPQLIDDIYGTLRESDFDLSKMMILEYSGYLEGHLWPHYGDEASLTHVLSIVVMINEKVRQGVEVWETIGVAFKATAAMPQDDPKVRSFFRRVFTIPAEQLSMKEQTILTTFLINTFQSFEQPRIRKEGLSVCSPLIWHHLTEPVRDSLISEHPPLQKIWRSTLKKLQKGGQQLERDYLHNQLESFLLFIEETLAPKAVIDGDELAYIERFVEWMIDLLNQLATRRWFRPLLQSKQFEVRCRLTGISEREEGKLFGQLLDILRFYEGFEINDHTGEPLSHLEISERHYHKMQQFQRVCFHTYPDTLKDVSLRSISSIDSRDSLSSILTPLPLDTLAGLTEQLHLIRMADLLGGGDNDSNSNSTADGVPGSKLVNGVTGEKEKEKEKETRARWRSPKTLKAFLVEVIISRLERRPDQLSQIRSMPLYPTQEVLWDPNLVPAEHYQGEFSLALPKLNLQFLTIHDYLLRNFKLFRLESTYEIREHLEDVILRVRPVKDVTVRTATRFEGQARMAVTVEDFSIAVVKKPKVGETVPSEVRAEVVYNLGGLQPHIRREWEELRQFDVLFMLAMMGSEEPVQGRVGDIPITEFPEKFGIIAVRGAEIIEICDEDGHVVSDPNPMERRPPRGHMRTARILLDPAQYQLDLDALKDTGLEELYGSFNLLVRRRPEENNFKAILQTIRSIMDDPEGTQAVVPDWLHDLFLGYGDPGSAQYFRLDTQIPDIDFLDTFLDRSHLTESFPDAEGVTIPEGLSPPYRVKFERAGDPPSADQRPPERLAVTTYTRPNKGPYPECAYRVNGVRFTPAQVEAIRSGVNPGLTMVVGPPGTGKTDTAVQIVNLLYHNFPNERTLLVAHSNQALNDLFEKIVALDIDERYLLRLGRGERLLEMDKDFSKWGRVNHMLLRRIECLDKVGRLATSLGLSSDVAYSCETAAHFYLYHIVSRIEEYRLNLTKAGADGSNLASIWPKVQRAHEKEIRKHAAERERRRRARGIKDNQPTIEEIIENPYAGKRKRPGKSARERLKKRRQELMHQLAEERLQQKLADMEKRKKAMVPDQAEAEPDGDNEADAPMADTAQQEQQQQDGVPGGGDKKVDTNGGEGDHPMGEGGSEAAGEGEEEEDEEQDMIDEERMGIDYSKTPEDLLASGHSVPQLLFPFREFFADAPQPLFTGDHQHDLDTAEGCFKYFEHLFKEVDECHAFELLRNQTERANYLLTKHAKVIAMTCTHAALTRHNLIDLRFKYDNLIMEESAQILEVETFIPMLLQQSERGVSRLKRVVLIGDHHQLPPVVKNRAFQRYGHLDQSLFSRFVRLQTPTVLLDKQGRARPEIATLYNWRYEGRLGDLPKVTAEPEYLTANGGLCHVYQFVDVGDFDGRGESAPQPFFYQNLGEAEYMVALYMFMRLIGYPASKITLLTTYNGQKALLNDVVRKRCGWNPNIGLPAKIETVDRYQGQQNDYVLLSLVRTNSVGHIRDIRRLVVAMSRARLGLYVFGRLELFDQCMELAHVFSLFKERPTQLALEFSESFQTDRQPSESGTARLVSDVEAMWRLLDDKNQEIVKRNAPTTAPPSFPPPPLPPPAAARPLPIPDVNAVRPPPGLRGGVLREQDDTQQVDQGGETMQLDEGEGGAAEELPKPDETERPMSDE
ncbi:unnamed protein product [Vitrella brassicaformis CCMP3155]|uniref:Pre-mRNA-splicing factor n=4 Tax=Vitrella brassicaformis TaxID=1169539 RepID=A0A0G4GBG8_VITBC|nr:unnamed protein product [Vitrella brassicaformis CCMP3155]|eukprot:CEM26013.1 unnamed protein product [Vitrella brassicaformis CCMP3155]